MPPRAKNACLAPAGAASELPPAPRDLDLPPGVLRRILAQHPLKFRLGTCSLVSSAWAAAASEATTAIVLTHIWHWKQHHYDSLAAWLGRHAASAGLQQLALDCADWRHNSFSPPWHQQQSLRVLNIASCELPASSMRELSHLTALTELSFCDVVTSSSSSSSGSSQVLTRSQAKEQQQKQVVLAATRPPARAAGPATVAATASELGCTLPRLHALVSLTLGGHTVSALLPALTAPAPAAGVNVLQQQLASLKLLETACITPELLAALPGTLTRLELQAVGPGLSQFPQGGWDITKNVLISQASTPQLGQLTQLQQLHLKGIGVTGRQPGSLTALFCGLTQLTAFSINGHSAVARGRLPATGSPELGEFMSAMGCLTNLRSLQMTGGFRCVHWELDSDDEELWWEEEEEEPPTDYAPLTAGLVASTSLTRLCLTNISLPQGCGPHMLGRPGLRLPHLAELHMVGYMDCNDDGQSFFADRCLTADDVCSLASCCEGGCLRQLTLKGVVKGMGAADWGCLSALTTLTYLSVDSSTKGVGQLVSLVELHLSRAEASDRTLADIATHLTQLRCFSARGMAFSDRAEQQFGTSMSYESVSVDGCEESGEESEELSEECEQSSEEERLSVCEQLAADLRAVGILPAAKETQGAASGCRPQ